MMKPFSLPDYDLNNAPVPPIQMLKEAADALSTTTGGRVEGSVFTGSLGGTGTYRHTFYLRAPVLDDFTDPLFYVWHEAELYPAHVLMAGENQKNAPSFNNAETLRDEIQRLLSSDVARQRIGAMLAQVDSSMPASYKSRNMRTARK